MPAVLTDYDIAQLRALTGTDWERDEDEEALGRSAAEALRTLLNRLEDG